MRYALLAPGKRLRPALVLMAAEACEGVIEDAIPGAVAVEMIHAYSLIHDDLPSMDDDDLRRGRPTCHIQFDEATAILAGDGLIAEAFSQLAENVNNPEISRQRQSGFLPKHQVRIDWSAVKQTTWRPSEGGPIFRWDRRVRNEMPIKRT